jgi:hypothetical protein
MVKTNTTQTHDTGMNLVATYVLLYIVNAVIIYGANMLFPKMVVLGNMSLTPFWGMFISMNALALIETLAMPFFYVLEKQLKRMLSPMEWMIGYFVLNFAGLWIISRFSGQLGLGVSSWLVVAGLAFVLDMVQGVAIMALNKNSK